MTTSGEVLTRPEIDPARGNEASRAAARYRAEWLLAITNGMATPFDLFKQASTLEGRPLLKLSLRQVLLAQPGWGRATTLPRLERFRRILAVHPSTKMSVAWLLDSRAGGRRFLTMLEVFTAAKTEPPWPGFPFAPADLSVAVDSLSSWSKRSEGGVYR